MYFKCIYLLHLCYIYITVTNRMKHLLLCVSSLYVGVM